MSFFNNIRNILKNNRNRRNPGGGLSDFRNNMNNRGLFGGNRQMNPFFNNLPRKNMLLPPSIAEAQGRNMANVGMLPSYMQPGGSGMPETDNRFADMPQPPEMQTMDMRSYTDAFGNQQTGSSSMARYHNQLKEYFAANPGAQDYYTSQNPPSKMPPVSPPFGNPIMTPGLLKPNPGPSLGGVDRIGNYGLEKENLLGTPNTDPNDGMYVPGTPGYISMYDQLQNSLIQQNPNLSMNLPNKNQPISPTLPTAGLPSLMQPPSGVPNYMPSGQTPKQMMPMYGSGGEAESSDFPDLSGDGEITKKDILIGRDVIEMSDGGDAAEKTFTDYQPEGALKNSIFDYIPDAYQVSAFLQDKLNRPMPVKSDLPSGSDADMMNYQGALQNYQEFYYSQPEAFRANLPSPAELYNEPEEFFRFVDNPAYREMMGEAGRGLGSTLMMGPGPLGRASNQIGKLLKQLEGPSMPDAPEKKSPNLPMMSR